MYLFLAMLSTLQVQQWGGWKFPHRFPTPSLLCFFTPAAFSPRRIEFYSILNLPRYFKFSDDVGYSPTGLVEGYCTRYFLSFSFFHLTYSRWTSSLPSCLWSQRIFPSLPGSRLTFFLSRCKFSTLTTRQPMVEFYLLTFRRFPLRKKEHKSYFGKNRTHDFRTSRCAAYLLDHSGQNSTSRPTRERNG